MNFHSMHELMPLKQHITGLKSPSRLTQHLLLQWVDQARAPQARALTAPRDLSRPTFMAFSQASRESAELDRASS